MPTPNRLARTVSALERLPRFIRPAVMSRAFNSQVRFAGTASIRFEELTEGRAVLTLANRRKVQNHIGGVHAADVVLHLAPVGQRQHRAALGQLFEADRGGAGEAHLGVEGAAHHGGTDETRQALERGHGTGEAIRGGHTRPGQ